MSTRFVPVLREIVGLEAKTNRLPLGIEGMSSDDCNREKLLFDVIDYLTRNYEIDERQITTTRSLSDSVTLTVHGDVGEFPGFGSSSVPVFEMSDEIEYGYVPRGNTLCVWTTPQSVPNRE